MLLSSLVFRASYSNAVFKTYLVVASRAGLVMGAVLTRQHSTVRTALFCRHVLLLTTFDVQDVQQIKEEHDVVVVGSGCSALTAAVVAKARGLDVLVVEKTRYFGGTTAYSGGGAWIPVNQHQQQLGVVDSVEMADEYLHNVLGKFYEPEKVAAFLQSAAQMVNWMEDNTAVRFNTFPGFADYEFDRNGGNYCRSLLTTPFDGRNLGRSMLRMIRYPLQGLSGFGTMQSDQLQLEKLKHPFASYENFRFAATKAVRYAIDLLRYGKGSEMCNGNALVGRLVYTAMSMNIPMRNNTKAIAPIVEDGMVKGVVLQTEDGNLVKVRANKAVVLAAGGFGRKGKEKGLVPGECSAVPAGNIGEGIEIGLSAGGALPATPNYTNAIYVPISLKKPMNGPSRRYPHFSDRSKPGSIFVDERGERFANEAQPYHSLGVIMGDKKIEKAYYIGDRKHLRTWGMGVALPSPYPIWNVLRGDYLLQAPTIRELAKKISIDPDKLEATVDRYNRFAKEAKDPDFGRGGNFYDELVGDPSNTANPSLAPCEQGPFYALPIYPGNASIMYGLRTDGNGRVLDDNSKPVPGLYAVGCDQNSVMRGTYPGAGSSIGPAMTFGYRAANFIADGTGNQ